MLLPLRHYHNFVTAPWCILLTDLLRWLRPGETAQILRNKANFAAVVQLRRKI